VKTLILKTNGMSAYGLQTFDTNRKINSFPTRSGVVGLLGAALGIERSSHNKLFELSENIKLAVQINASGTKISDYHTVQGFRSPGSKKIQVGSTKQTYREYWCDSEYTFAITANDDVISNIVEAIKSPVYTLFQGRKSCPLTRPLFEKLLAIDNPVDAIQSLDSVGHIYSDVDNGSFISHISVRDKHTSIFRKFINRTVFMCEAKVRD
jgi:CRISPR system Cascade subunit CasD